jgi:hypothetical protein
MDTIPTESENVKPAEPPVEPVDAAAKVRATFTPVQQAAFNSALAETRREFEHKNRKETALLQLNYDKLAADHTALQAKHTEETTNLSKVLAELTEKHETVTKTSAESQRLAEQRAGELQTAENNRKIATAINGLADFYDADIAQAVLSQAATIVDGEVRFTYQGQSLSAVEFANVIETTPKFYSLTRSRQAGGVGAHNGNAGVAGPVNGPVNVTNLAKSPGGVQTYMDLRKKARAGDKAAQAQIGLSRFD